MIRQAFAAALALGLLGAPAWAAPLDDLKAFAEASAAGRVEEAAAFARTLLKEDAESYGLTAGEGRELAAQLADALAAAGDIAGAIAVYEDVLAELEAEHGADALEIVPALQRLAELEAERGGDDKAEARLERAAAITQAALGDEHESVRNILALGLALTERRLERLKSQSEAQDRRKLLKARVKQLQQRLARINEAAKKSKEATFGMGAEPGASSGAGKTGPALSKPAPAKPIRDAIVREDAEAPSDEFELVPVYYGVNRKRTGRPDPQSFYGGDRAPLETGVVTVSVPKNRALGAIPKPSLWRAEFRPDPAKHVILTSIAAYPGLEPFIAELRGQIARSGRREAIVFIHGYNTEFAGAAERAAQLAVDLEIDGAALMYSWPSKGGVLGYVADGAQVIKPVVHDLETFLTLVATESRADRLHLIAHSMGNRYLLEALEGLKEEGLAAGVFDEVVFASPDVDAEDFAARLPEIAPLAGHMTLYASAEDRALQLSKLVNGSYPRAGDAANPLVVTGLETIDTTPASGKGLGHDDVFGPALDDFRAVVWFSLAAPERCVLKDRPKGKGVYWAYGEDGPAVCEPAVFKAAVTMLRRLGRQATLDLLTNQIELTTNAKDLKSAERWSAVKAIVEGIEL